MSGVPKIKLNNGADIPVVGLGTWKSAPGEVKQAVITAIKNGYRHIDCAMAYDNEWEVGEAFKECFPHICKREEVFVTTKLWLTDFDQDEVESALKCSLKKLGLDYIDLYLVHWPIKQVLKCPKRDPNDHKNWFKGFDTPIDTIPYSNDWFCPTWAALERCVEKGLTRAIGVSNFSAKRIGEVLKVCKIKPAMNQIELHPGLSQAETIQFCVSNGINVTAYSPLGSPDRPDAFKDPKNFAPLTCPQIQAISKKFSKSPAQVLIRWAVQRGTVVIPKSVSEKRIVENISVFDFTLSTEDMDQINNLNTNNRTFTGATFFGGDEKLVREMWE